MPTAQSTITSTIVIPTRATRRGDVEERTGGVQVVRAEDALERRDEDLADVEDARHQAVGLASVEQEQDDPRPEDDLDQPEPEDDDAPGHLGTAGAGSRDWAVVWTVSWPPEAVGVWVMTFWST